MKFNIIQLLFIPALLLLAQCSTEAQDKSRIIPADELTGEYMPLLQGKQVALIINRSSQIDGVSLLDIMLKSGINVKKIFVPEHGFRGDADAGAHVANSVDSATGIPVISLYGSNKKPKPEQLSDIDIMVYDLQDVGTRFYTYISTLQYCMAAAAENNVAFVILDKPNPNGFYVDGPVLEADQSSFVGMQRIPIVYGMTPGEYAGMLIGEHWVNGLESLNINVIKCKKYTHKSKYVLAVPPSPNLRTIEAIYAYPSLCLFEGTKVSVGRGTDLPFRIYGCPEFKGTTKYSFTPVSMHGATNPPYKDKQCYGYYIAPDTTTILQSVSGGLRLHWLIKAYKDYPNKNKFFNAFFKKLAGTEQLQQQIEQGMTEKEIKSTWEEQLNTFKNIRKKYLLYPDF